MLKQYRVKCSYCKKKYFGKNVDDWSDIVLGRKGIAQFRYAHNIRGTVTAVELRGKTNAKKS